MRNDAETVERLLAGQADGSRESGRCDAVVESSKERIPAFHVVSHVQSNAGRTDIVFTRAEGGWMGLHRIVQLVATSLVSSDESFS